MLIVKCCNHHILYNVTGIIIFGICHFVLFRNARSANVTTKSSFCFAIIIDDIPLYLQNVAIKVKGFFTALTAFNSPTSHFETTHSCYCVPFEGITYVEELFIQHWLSLHDPEEGVALYQPHAFLAVEQKYWDN